MTREEAIYRLRVMQAANDGAFEDSVKNGLKADEPYAPGETMTFREFFKADHESYDMAIKALEDKDVLDKIRSEIKGMTPTYHNPDWSITDLVPISKVLEIIDKYKAESEDKECR